MDLSILIEDLEVEVRMEIAKTTKSIIQVSKSIHRSSTATMVFTSPLISILAYSGRWKVNSGSF